MSLVDRWDEPAVERALASDPDAILEDGVTAIWHAAYFGRTAWVERLLNAGARIDAHDDGAIERAAGSTRVLSIWMGVPDPGYPATTGRSTLLHAAVSRAGDAALIDLLIARGISVDAPDRFGCTPLHLAAANDRSALVRMLIERGADVNAIDRAGYAPLDHAWSRSEVLETLLALGASPDGGPHVAWSQTSYEWTALTHAASAGRADVVRRLIDAGADLAKHREALPLAAKSGHAEVVRTLVDAGAPLDATTNWRGKNRRPLASAAMYASLPCVELLLPRCPDDLDAALQSAVQLASDDYPTPPNDRTAARVELVRFLLARGAKPDAALIDAAKAELEIYMQLLLEAGARPDVTDEYGQTPLIHVARFGRYRAAKLLLARGADPRVRALDGKTAYETAEAAYRQENVADARLVMSAIADAGGGPPKKVEPAKTPAGPQLGGRVQHTKFGGGTITTVDGEKLTIRFDSGDSKTLLTKFVTQL